MIVHNLKQTQILPISPEEAWDFFATPKNLDRMTPDKLGFKITYLPSEKMYTGQIITYKIKILPLLWVPWVTEITHVDTGKCFVDNQISGPYKLWHHLHTFEPHEDGVLMTDLIHYSIGFSVLGEIPHALFVRKKLEYIFNYRKETLRNIFSSA